MIHVADIEFWSGRWRRRYLPLRMTAQTKVRIANGEQLCIDRAVRAMTDRAAFSQGGVFENKWPRLLAMALGASFVQARHGCASRRFHDVEAVRVVALTAIHFPFGNWMMLRQMELCVDIEVALITGLRIFAGINNEFFAAGSADGDVFACRAVAGFASALACHSAFFQMEPGVRACWKCARDVTVAIRAHLVPDERGALDHGRGNHGSLHCGTGAADQGKRGENPVKRSCCARSLGPQAAHVKILTFRASDSPGPHISY